MKTWPRSSSFQTPSMASGTIHSSLELAQLIALFFDNHLVILPEGVVQCVGGDIQGGSWLNFARIDSIKLAQRTEINSIDGDGSTRTYYWLDVYFSDGTYLNWGIRGCFGDTAYLCKTIIAAYNHYWTYNRSYY